MTEVSTLIENYWSWLKDNTQIQPVDDWYQITTPYLDRHNDFVQIYARRNGDSFQLTDDGSTINDLEMSGCGIDTPKRKRILQTAVNGFGVKINGNELTTEAPIRQFGLHTHNLIQAILAVGDLFYLASPHVRSLFVEDVRNWLDQSHVIYEFRPEFTGKTGYKHKFDFMIPKSPKAPERLLQHVSPTDKNTVERVIMSWVDIQETLSEGSRMYGMLDDRNTTISQLDKKALDKYGIKSVPWTQREKSIDELAA